MKKQLFLMLSLMVSVGCMAQRQNPMVVKTESGLVKGIDQEGSMGFLGIPYAKVERFMPPKPVDKWNTIRVCDHWGPQAMQNTWGRKLSEAEMSEQCCVLNVWTTNTKASKPVMVWLHGGGFDSGTSAWNPGMQLAKKDVVVVSVNHRLNILGFLDLSAVSEKYKYSGNVGMLDVVQALQWVQKNIRQFGGDPSNVTIFGESGGGGKVGTLLSMPAAKGLFHKAIIMSGTILNVNTKAMTEELGLAVLKELNIDAAHIEDIAQVPYDTLYAAGQRAMATSIGTRKPGTPMMWGFGPTPDGETLLQQPFQPDFASISNHVPILIGTTFNELQRLRYDQPMTQDEARRELFRTFGFDTNNYLKAFAEAYPNHTPQDLLSIDWLFRPKTIITADAISETRQAPTYMYMFTWRSPVNKGSVHGHELKFCFNTLHHAANELPQPTKDDLRLADTMSSVWAQFAHNGNPNVKGLPEWHPYTKESGELMVFDYQCAIRHNPDRQLEELIDKHCFQQLDDFRAKQSSRQIKVGDITMTIYPTRGAKIMSLKYKGQEVISQQTAPESFGGTFWTSPQKEWNWPPVQEFDKLPFSVEERAGRLIMTSEVSEKLKYRVRKSFATDKSDNAIVITYSIINESDETRQVAPWEVTRVANDGGVIFFDAPIDGITPANLLPFTAAHGAVWYQTDEAPQNRKINSDGKGWLGYYNKGLLLLKTFDDLEPSQPAPDESEIQVYMNRGKTFIELESQGAYTTLKPHETLNWTVRWYLMPVEGESKPSEELMKAVRKVTAPPLLKTRVETGDVEGVLDDGLAVYRAIPYAAPPVGNLRWKAPQPAQTWKGVRVCDTFGPLPPQPTRPGRTADMMNEDCLYLGIATPAKSADERLPVMVWIHGGGFQTEHYGGDLWTSLAHRGVVIVSIEYRTGALGFMAHPELSKESPDGHSGNYGLLDQIYALQWVQRNIANFGGDPSKVTIFGESAGAISCSMLTGSPLTKGLFRAVISHSGGSFAPWSDQPRTLGLDASQKGAEQQGLAFQKHLKKKNIKQMRKMNAMELCDGNVGFAGFWPCVDGYVICDDQYRLYERGEYNDVPVIVMTNSDEGALFSPGNIKAEDYQKTVRNIFGSFADEALKVYPGNTDDEAWHGYGDAFRDMGFAWPSFAWVSLQSKTGKSAAYAAYLAQPSTLSFSQDPRRRGVAHADDIMYLNNTFLSQSDKYPKEAEVAEMLQQYWVNFAKTCNPNGEGLPYWPTFDQDKPTTMQFSNGASLIMVPNREQIDFVDRFYKAKREETEQQRR